MTPKRAHEICIAPMGGPSGSESKARGGLPTVPGGGSLSLIGYELIEPRTMKRNGPRDGGYQYSPMPYQVATGPLGIPFSFLLNAHHRSKQCRYAWNHTGTMAGNTASRLNNFSPS
jgi:hypothetical protein